MHPPTLVSRLEHNSSGWGELLQILYLGHNRHWLVLTGQPACWGELLQGRALYPGHGRLAGRLGQNSPGWSASDGSSLSMTCWMARELVFLREHGSVGPVWSEVWLPACQPEPHLEH